MLSKNEVKYIQTLGHKKSRDKEGVFIAEGPKMLEELIAGDFEIVKAFMVEGAQQVKQQNAIPITEISQQELERISNLKTPNKVLVIAKQKVLSHEPKVQGKITLVLDGIQDPGNMGTIIRIADWFGITEIVASENSVELYNAKVVQATMGSLCRVSVWYKKIEGWLPDISVPVYGALLNGKSVYKIDKVEECILVIGNESKGIHSEILSLINEPITIPKIGGAESLNAAVATGIILSHLVK